MKPEENVEPPDADTPAPIAGDVIGDTAYSERFVLKILLKLANLNTLEEEIKDKSFEEDICTLWDMTAEKDVVLFLLKHDILKLFCFALSKIDSNRIIEIIIGIVGNICCQREGVDAFLENEDMLVTILQYLRSDDSQILIQLLRLISSCLYLADDDELAVWMNIFDNIDYANVIYFIMKNSTNKDLLINVLENFNTLSTFCNVENLRQGFFSQFVTIEALDSVAAAFNELSTQDSCETEEIERIQVITLQLAMNLVGFDKSPEIYYENRESVIGMINQILKYYEDKFKEQKFINVDIFDIIESANTILNVLEVSNIASPNQIFIPGYNIWKTMKGFIEQEIGDKNDFEETQNEEKLKQNYIKTMVPLSLLLCIYMSRCTDDNLVKVLDEINRDYETILDTANNIDLRSMIEKRTSNYWTRLKDNDDS